MHQVRSQLRSHGAVESIQANVGLDLRVDHCKIVAHRGSGVAHVDPRVDELIDVDLRVQGEA
eukprot:4369290-Prymnesium_polylepis.1